MSAQGIGDIPAGFGKAIGSAVSDIADLALNGDPFVRSVLGLAGLTTLGPLLGAGMIAAPSITGGLISVGVPVATIANNMNTIVDVAGNFVEGNTSATTPAGQAVATIQHVANKLYDKMIQTTISYESDPDQDKPGLGAPVGAPDQDEQAGLAGWGSESDDETNW